MKQFQGSSYNITADILGKVTFGCSNPFNRKDCILIKENTNKVPCGYKALVTNHTVISDKPYISTSHPLEEFHEGDVVLLSKSGEIKFLYEIQSKHNAVFVTERCNHRCIMCPQPPVVHEEDKTNFNIELIRLFDKNTESVGITGGEPTMIGDQLFEIIKQINIACPNASIGILSNGVKFADKDYALKLAKCRCCDMQIDIPIFSDIASIHNHIVGAHTFYKTIQGIYNLAQLGQRIGIRVVVHKLTYQRLPQLAGFIYHNLPFVEQVAFLQMETTGLAEKNLNELWIDPYDYNQQLLEAVEYLRDRDIPVYIFNSQLCILPKSLHSIAMQSITDWKDGYISECQDCILKDKCAGLFTTNGVNISKHINKVEHS